MHSAHLLLLLQVLWLSGPTLATWSQVQVLDLTQTDPDLKGFIGGFADGVYGYVVPYHNGVYFGKVARFRLSDFGGVEVLDLTQTDPDLKGFRGGFADGVYGYVVPYYNGFGVYLGKVARFRLSDFGGVEVLDLTQTDPDLKGFYVGFADSVYGYVVPHKNGVYFGKVARFRLSDFGGVEVLDLTQTDPDLKGFVGGFADGVYGYVVPDYNGAKFGKVARFRVTPATTTSTSTTTTNTPCAEGNEPSAAGCSPCPQGTHSNGGSPCLPLLGFVATYSEASFMTQAHGFGITSVDLVATELPPQVYGGNTLENAVDMRRELASLAPGGPCSRLWLPWNGTLRATLTVQDLDHTCYTNVSISADEVVWSGYIAAFLLERNASGTREVRRWPFPISFHLNRSVAAYYNTVYALGAVVLGPEVRVHSGSAPSTLELFLSHDFTFAQRPGVVLHENDTVFLEQRLVEAIAGIGLEVSSVWLEGSGLQGGPILHDLTSTLRAVEPHDGGVRQQVTLRACVQCTLSMKSLLVASNSGSQTRRLRGPATTLANISLSVLGSAAGGDDLARGMPAPWDPDLPLDPPLCLLVAGVTAIFFGVLTRLAIAASKKCQKFAGFAFEEFLDAVTDIVVYIACAGEGDLEFGNDQNDLLATALLVSTSVNFGLLMLEIAVWGCGPKCVGFGLPPISVPWLACIHLMLEDVFQLVLYAIVSAAQTKEGLGQRPAVILAVVQSGLFIIWKLRGAVDWEAIAARVSWTGVAADE